MKRREKEAISAETVRHVAKTARLGLTESEVRRFQQELSDILEAFRELDKAETTKEPSLHPMPLKDVFREDKAESCLPREKALENTAHKEKGFFRGPKVV